MRFRIMALGVDQNCEVSSPTELKSEKKSTVREGKAMGSRRIFSVKFKLQVLDSFHKDADCQGNQRATARKYGIHRRQVQKWLQMENSLRSTAQSTVICDGINSGGTQAVALNLCPSRQRDASSVASTLSNTKDSSAPGFCSGPASTSSNASTSASSDSEGYINVDGFSDDEDDLDDSCSSISSTSVSDKALDFTCAALSKRKFYSVDFKLQVLDSFHHDESCHKNQRATARKFGVHHRQIQKWLNKEQLLRNEILLRSNRRTVLGKPQFSKCTSPASGCLDLSNHKRSSRSRSVDEPAPKRKPLLSCCRPEDHSNIVSTTGTNETLRLIKSEPHIQACSTPEVSSSADLYCPSSVFPYSSVALRSSFSIMSPSEYPTYDPNSWPFYYPSAMRQQPEKPLPRRPSPLDLKVGSAWLPEFQSYLPNFLPKLDLQSSPHLKYAEFRQISADGFKLFTASATSYSMFS